MKTLSFVAATLLWACSAWAQAPAPPRDSQAAAGRLGDWLRALGDRDRRAGALEEIFRNYTGEVEAAFADDARLSALGADLSDELVRLQLEQIRSEGPFRHLESRLSPPCRQNRNLAWWVIHDTGDSLWSSLRAGADGCGREDMRAILDALLGRLSAQGRSPDAGLQRAAAFVIGSQRFQEELPFLLSLLAQRDISSRLTALRCLGLFGEDAVPAVEAFLADPPAWAAAPLHPAIRAMGTGRPDHETSLAFGELLGSPEPEARLFALEGLALLAIARQDHLNAIWALAQQDEWSDVRRAAARAYHVIEPITASRGPGGGPSGGLAKPPVSGQWSGGAKPPPPASGS